MSTADELEDFYTQTITLQGKSEGPWGEELSEPSEPLRCFIDDVRQLIRDPQGTEVVSETLITAPKEHKDRYQTGMTANLPHRQAEVIAVGVAESGDQDLPDHIQVWLT